MANETDGDEARQIGSADGNLLLDLHVLDQRIGRLVEVALIGAGVTPAEFAVYSQLGIAPMTPRQLSQRLGVKRSTLTGHLAALDRRGHVSRSANPLDARSYRVELTDAGRACLETCRPAFRRALTVFHDALGQDPDRIRTVLADLDTAAAAAIERLDRDP
ncbi:MarR family winged helix-turn-helix transcriptional regulator [Microlunatus speluncae]|uniref:MarR family winged helix-turn-helix transcriptional regulator n=1 Tax=Microlunatus speluncae TaxID=2594267 RepID=UPI0012662B23|nr:MarR family transcriptional regulator [Microlunatus speluncae]